MADGDHAMWREGLRTRSRDAYMVYRGIIWGLGIYRGHIGFRDIKGAFRV